MQHTLYLEPLCKSITNCAKESARRLVKFAIIFSLFLFSPKGYFFIHISSLVGSRLYHLLLIFVSIFLIHPSEEFVEIFFLLDFPVFILWSSEGLIISCKCFDCSYGQADDSSYIGASLLGFVLALLLLRIVGIVILRQPPKS